MTRSPGWIGLGIPALPAIRKYSSEIHVSYSGMIVLRLAIAPRCNMTALLSDPKKEKKKRIFQTTTTSGGQGGDMVRGIGMQEAAESCGDEGTCASHQPAAMTMTVHGKLGKGKKQK